MNRLLGCPDDGTTLPSLVTSVPEVQACYCPFCKELTAFIQTRFVTSYTWSASEREWLLARTWGNEAEKRLAGSAVAGLPGQWITASSALEMVDYLDAPEMSERFHRKLRLFCCAAVRRYWSELADERLRAGVEVAESFADGLVTATEMGGSFSKFLDAMSEAKGKFIAEEAAAEAAYYAVYVPSMPHELLVAAAILNPSGLTSEEAHIGLLRDIFGPLPLNPPSIVPDWLLLDSDILDLAEAAYEDRKMPEGWLDKSKLASLADLLEQHGCQNETVLGHLRGPGPHARGCWAVDVILGKS